MPGRYSMWLFREEGSVSSWCFRARAWGEKFRVHQKMVFHAVPPLSPGRKPVRGSDGAALLSNRPGPDR